MQWGRRRVSFNSLTAVVADRRQIITLPPKKQLGADKQTSCDKQLAADKQLGAALSSAVPLCHHIQK